MIGVKAGQRVLVIGAGGGVSTLAVQIAEAFGARIIGVCGGEGDWCARWAPTT